MFSVVRGNNVSRAARLRPRPPDTVCGTGATEIEDKSALVIFASSVDKDYLIQNKFDDSGVRKNMTL